jgi:cytochrome c-type biogenesis protein CcmH/NrfF
MLNKNNLFPLIILFILGAYVFKFQYVPQHYQGLDVKIKSITKNVKCLDCSGVSVYDSRSEFANMIKLKVKAMLEQGLSREAIYAKLQQAHGDDVLYNTVAYNPSAILWGLPILFGLISLIAYRKGYPR